MRILIAEDEMVSRRMLETTLEKWGHQVVTTRDGHEALSVLQREDAPSLVILDVMMPCMSGVEVCKKIREMAREVSPYLILLTSKHGTDNVVLGLESGANDYVTKPFDQAELRARINVGCHVLNLQEGLAQRVRELEAALLHVKQLQGMLPICSYCKSVRDDQNYWQQVESYLSQHSSLQFSHGICPKCYEKVVEPQLEEMRRNRKA
jgi:sigma-B regulation protein RsbU (phosphoserine phosphatase)